MSRAPDGSRHDALTEAYVARRLVEVHGHELRWDHERRVWFIYRNDLWRPDRDGQVTRFVLDEAEHLRSVGLAQESKEVVKLAAHCESAVGIGRVVQILQDLEPVASAGGNWDSDPWLLGTPSGVVDLCTGQLRLGTAQDLITMTTRAAYTPEADCPRWERFLGEIFGGDQALIEHIHRALGYGLTGITTEQRWWLAEGGGANGKTTLVTAVAHALGDYAFTVPFSTLEKHHRSSIPDDVAHLVGKRFVSASETIEGARLDEARIKSITGGDKVTARHLYGRYFEFNPALKLWLSCNHKPVVHDDSHGFWRRVIVIPFRERFDGARRDDNLLDELKAEAEGILAWLVEGCLLWQSDGLQIPGSVTAATTEYRESSDPLTEFIAECCEIDRDARGGATELFGAYSAWADRRGLRDRERLDSSSFGRRMGERFKRDHTRRGNVYQGVSVRAEADGAEA